MNLYSAVQVCEGTSLRFRRPSWEEGSLVAVEGGDLVLHVNGSVRYSGVVVLRVDDIQADDYVVAAAAGAECEHEKSIEGYFRKVHVSDGSSSTVHWEAAPACTVCGERLA